MRWKVEILNDSASSARKLYMCTRMCTFMATKTITITEEAYNNLLKEKRTGESFTDTINRLTRSRKLSDSLGEWVGSRDELDGIEELIRNTWKESWSGGVDL